MWVWILQELRHDGSRMCNRTSQVSARVVSAKRLTLDKARSSNSIRSASPAAYTSLGLQHLTDEAAAHELPARAGLAYPSRAQEIRVCSYENKLGSQQSHAGADRIGITAVRRGSADGAQEQCRV